MRLPPLLPLLSLLSLPPTTLAATSGCTVPLPPSLTPGTSTHNLTLTSRSVIGETTERNFIVRLPASYGTVGGEQAPLVVVLHGQMQPAWSMERIWGVDDGDLDAAERGGFEDAVVVFPEGLDWQDPGVQWLGDPLAPPSSTIDDRLFITELLDHLSSTLCLNEHRFYAAGLSNGGGLTALLMCDPALNTRFAAFATVAGAFYPDASLTEPLFESGCRPALNGRRLPYMNLHGRADTVVAFNGTNVPPPASIAVDEWVGGWAERNGCDEVPSEGTVEGGSVQEKRWVCGGEGDVVVQRVLEGFGHGWPSVSAQGEPFETLRGGPTTWDATPFIMEWFAKWTL